MLSWLLLLAPPTCAPCAAQEPSDPVVLNDPDPKVVQKSDEPQPSDPAAVAFFEKLIQAQSVEENLPPVSGFAVQMAIRLFLPEGGNDFDLSLYFKTEPFETVRLLVDDANHGTRVEKGFDKDGFWLRDGDKELHSLDGHEFEQDREAIDEAMVLCNDFMLLFDLKRLKRKASELQLEQSDERTLIRGKLRRGREKWAFELHIPKAELLPSRLSLQPPIPKAKPADKTAKAEAAAPENQAGSSNGTQAQAEGEPNPAIKPNLPPRLHYEFGDWIAYEGRLLPSWIEEFHAEDLTRPLRIMEIGDFLWRDPDKLQTHR